MWASKACAQPSRAFLCHCRDLLPSVVRGQCWSPERHAAYPSAFRPTAKTLLAIDALRGFGAQPRAGSPSGVQLPEGVLHHILRLAAPPVWLAVPEMRPCRSFKLQLKQESEESEVEA